eukprot:scaffold441_cov382-Prasinococcus_capsulatus_cf.AAC.7
MARIRSLHDIQAEFADLPPVLQSEGPDTIVQIQYSDEYSQVMDIFRAVLKSKEYSPRALRLTVRALHRAPGASRYVIHLSFLWCPGGCHRPQQLQLHGLVVSETSIGQRATSEHDGVAGGGAGVRQAGGGGEPQDVPGVVPPPEHRGEAECAFQSSDDKNYHAWAHRQWAVRLFSLWGSELEFTDRLIEADNRNNSAWNQRLWVLRYIDGGLAKYRAAELESLRRMLERVPNNTCGWHHLLAILPQDASVASYVPELVEIAEGALSADAECCDAHEFIVELSKMLLRNNLADASWRVRAYNTCRYLSECDPIRKDYWMYRSVEFED